ncbi:YVTN family beta-propeller protein [Catenulispora sp. GAS73]|uniref:cell wall-binding repeat-containing protein n=1 Tax=Catenulispora sp. GAS73 TaxID=3156269 RepID=UPI003512C49E
MTITRKYGIAVASLSVLAASIGPSVTPASAASAASGDTMLYIPGDNSNTASVTAYDLTRHSTAATFNTGPASQAVVSPDGSTAYVALSDGHVTVINTATNTITDNIALTDSADAIALTPNGATAYVASTFGNSVPVINTATKTEIAEITVGSAPSGIAISPDGSTAYVTNGGGNTVSVINTATNTVTANYAVGSNPGGIAVAPGGSDVYVANQGDDTVSVLNFAAGTKSTIAVGKSPTSVAITPDGSTAYVANSLGNSVSVIDTATGTVTRTISITAAGSPYGITISADGSTAYASCPGFHGDAAVTVIDTRTKTVTNTITGLETASGIPAVAVTPYIGTGTGTGTAVTRLGGTDRYATGRQVSQTQWRNGSANAVVLARGDAAPDALAGGPLAAHLHGPLLLTQPAALDLATRAEIDRVLGGPASGKSVYILGGDNAISPAIQTGLKKAGYNVVRLSGEDRFATALAVAKQFGPTSEAIVATGLDFPDALAAGPLGAVRNAPIVLSNGTTLDPATASFLAAHKTIDAVGGAAGKAAARLGSTGRTVNVLAGGDRFATAEDVAAAVVRTTGHAPTAVGVAYAFNFPDALTGGAFAANASEPLLLTGSTTADPGLLAALNGWRSSVTAVEIFGGKTVISQNTENQIANAIGGHES